MDKIEQKQRRVIERIISEISPEKFTTFFKADPQLKKLAGQHADAQRKQAYLTVRIIESQIDARKDQIRYEVALQIMRVMVNDGSIARYLDPEDATKQQVLRYKLYQLYNGIDSVLLDMEGLYLTIGIKPNLKIMPDVKKARTAIADWSKDNTQFTGTEFEPIINQEEEMLQNYLDKRVPVMLSKLQRATDRYLKQHPEETPVQI